MPRVELTQLLETGAHFGHLTRRWNPKMKPYIFMEKNGIHIIDLKKTQQAIDVAAEKLEQIVSEGHSILFVGTKKQAKAIIAREAKRSNSNWVSERWLGGMLTNFKTIKQSIRKLEIIEQMEEEGQFELLTKKEALMLKRKKEKLLKYLGGIRDMKGAPDMLFVVDTVKERIAVQEANKLKIPVVAPIDTNCDPDVIDYPIPGNDDAIRSIQLFCKEVSEAIIEGKELREQDMAEEEAQQEGVDVSEEEKKEIVEEAVAEGEAEEIKEESE